MPSNARTFATPLVTLAFLIAADAAAADDHAALAPIFRDNATGAHLEDSLRFRTREWSLEIQPGVWFAASRGDVRMPGGSTFLVEDLNFDDLTLAPTLEARLRFGEWQVDANAAFFRYDDDSSVSRDADLGAFTIATGERLDVRLNYTHLHLKAGRRVWTAGRTDARLEPFEDGTPAPSSSTNIDLELFAGLRFIDYDLRLRALTGGAAGQRVEASETWFQPTIGAALRIDFENRFSIDATTNIGGWYDSAATAFSFDVTAGLGYAFTSNIQAELGYRYIWNGYDKGSDDFKIGGSVAGLFAALTLRF